MFTEKRKRLPPLPPEPELGKLLTLAQLMASLQLQGYGWTLRIVRTRKFQETVLFLHCATTHTWLAIEPDGRIHTNVTLRDEDLENKQIGKLSINPARFKRTEKVSKLLHLR